LRRGIGWNVVATAFAQGSVFLANVVVARLLGLDVFGEFSMVQSTVLALTAVAQLATGITAAKYVAEFRATDKERASRILGLCSVVTIASGVAATVLLLAGSPWLSAAVLKAPQLGPPLVMAASAVLLSVMSGYQSGALAGLEGFRALARAGILQGLIHVGVCTAAASLWGLTGALLGLVVSAGARWYVLNVALRAEAHRQGLKVDMRGLGRRERTVLLHFIVPSAAAGFTTMPALWLGNAVLAQQANGFSQLAMYTAANNFKVIVLVLPALLNSVGMSLLNYQRGAGTVTRYRRVFWANMTLTGVSIGVGASFVAAFGDSLLSLFGVAFVEGYPVLLLLMLSALFEAFATAAYQVIQSQERMWLSFWAIALPRDVMVIVLALYLTPAYGALGLAMAYSFSWIVASIVTAIIVRALWHDVPAGMGVRAL
jgi:O-antigen/teichoic acid export membrane protein